MNWLFDSPVTILLGTLAVGFFLGVAWVQTGRYAFLYAIGGVFAIAVALLIAEYNIKTDREQVRDLIFKIAAEIEANDAESVISHIVGSKPEMAERGRKEMQNHKFSSVSIGTIHRIVEHPNHIPPEIIIEFNVSVVGDFFHEQMPARNVQRWFRLTFWKEPDGQWRLADYDHDEPTAFRRRQAD